MQGRVAGVVVLALLLVAAGVVLLVTELSGGTGQERPERPGYLLASNRTHLSLCVDAAGSGSITGHEENLVSTAIARAFTTLTSVPPEFGQSSVTAGCPAPVPLTGKRFGFDDLCCLLAKGFADAAQLSLHRIFVYFVADSTYDASFGGDRPFAIVTAESLCKGDTCAPMTVSIYAPDSIADAELANAVLKSLGLEPRTPEPTMDWASCERGGAPPGCERYLHCLTPTYELQCKFFWDEIGTPPPR